MATEIRFVPPPGLRKQMEDAVRLFGRPDPLLKAWGVQVLSWVGQAFRDGGRPAWKPLAESTKAGRRGKGGGKPLQNTGAYRSSFDMRLETNRVVVFSTSPVAPFHEFGTKGPYEIRPKNAKALALPFLPSRDAGKGSAGTGKAGRFSFAGLGRSRRTATGGRLVAPTGHPRAGKTVAPATNLAFYAKVTHPGIAARPVFPTPQQILPLLRQVGEALILRVLGRQSSGGGLPPAAAARG